MGSIKSLLVVGIALVGACSDALAPEEAPADPPFGGEEQGHEEGEESAEEDHADGGSDDSPDAAVVEAGAEDEPDAGPPAPPAPKPVKGVGFDGDGVLMIHPVKSGGPAFRLGTNDLNTVKRFEIERGTKAVSRTQAKVRFWNVPSHPLNYASGGTGYTSRFHIFATGKTQNYTWKNTPGYLGAPNDLKNQEFTVYARAHALLDAKRAAFTLKVRGGKHTAQNPDLASCTMMNLAGPKTSGVARFGKELTHPTHDYVKLKPKVDAELTDNAWVGLKLVTYQRDASSVMYRMYIDTDPFDANGKPNNRFFLFSEYIDKKGKNTGTFSKMADWGGMQTTFRTDGVQSVDIAVLSVREIVPP